MTTRELLTDALNGQTPERTPLSFGSWMTGDPYTDDLFADNWKRLYDQGLGFSHHCQMTRQIEHGVKESVEYETRNSDVYTVRTKQTPLGPLQEVKKGDWIIEHWIKTHHDYKKMKWIVENTEQITCYETYEEQLGRIGDYGIVVMLASRSPIMSINVDWAGIETFCMDIALQVPELHELYEVRKKFFLEETRLIAVGPVRFVKWPENVSASMLGPQRYDELLMPIYQEAMPIMEKGGKRVMVHYDGLLAAVADGISRAPFHILESLTEPPEGDMTYEKCREAWPNKVFWGNINQHVFSLPEAELRETVVSKRQRAGKKGFAFEIYEYLPANWEETIPTILDALRDVD